MYDARVSRPQQTDINLHDRTILNICIFIIKQKKKEANLKSTMCGSFSYFKKQYLFALIFFLFCLDMMCDDDDCVQ